MASTSIQRSRTAGTTKTKFTISMWVKRADNAAKYLLVNYTDDANRALFQFGGSDELLFQQRVSNSLQVSLQTNRKFRDPNGWYAITLTGDSTLAASADRLKLFVNGVRETSFATDTQLSQDSNYYINEATTNGFRIGEKGDGSDYFNGLMSHVHFCDGYAYEASAFGSTDATTGEWKINTSPSVTYGTNGFFLKMEDSSNMDLDSSSNALTFTTNGTLTKSECCPSNVFATWNPLGATAISYKNGNNTIYNSTNWQNSYSTLGMTKGKYYAEFKTLTADKAVVGINPINTSQSTITGISGTNNRWGYGDGARDGRVLTYNGGAGTKSTGGSDSTYSSGSISANDVLMVAVDMDNYIIWTGVNGTWHNSATATEIQNGTTTNAMFTGFNSTSDTWFFAGTVENSTLEANFGNGYFGTTAISSEGTNASGIGKFEYDVPTGYTALSTKGLNE